MKRASSYVKVKKAPCGLHWFTVWLKVGCQSFRITPLELSKDEAKWNARQLATALSKIQSEARK